jgi:hypothetical protein
MHIANAGVKSELVRNRFLHFFVLLAMGAIFANLPSAAADVIIRQVAVQGDPSPIAGATFSGFEAPTLSDDGRVLFSASLSGATVSNGNNNGLFMAGASGGSTPSLLVRQGAVSPIGGQAYGGAFINPMLRGGTLLFNNTPLGTSTAGLFGGTNLASPALIGQSQNFSINGRVNAAGDVAFGIVDNGDSQRQFFAAPKNGSTLSPATPLANGDGAMNLTSEISLNDQRQVLFSAGISGLGQGLFMNSLANPGTPTPMATFSQSAPWVAPGAQYSSILGGSLNNKGDVAYVAAYNSPTGSGDGLFLRTANGTHTLLAKKGDVSPAGGTFSSFQFVNMGQTLVTNSGTVVFAARTSIWDLVLADTAIYAMGPGGNRAIARENDHVPDMPSNVVYADFFTGGNYLGADPSGRVWFVANLYDTKTTLQAGEALMLYDPATDQVHSIFHTGDLYDLHGDGSLIAKSYAISMAMPDTLDLNNHNQPSAIYGDQFAFQMFFTNGMSGIYTATLPEPSGIFATLTASILAMLRRPQRSR